MLFMPASELRGCNRDILLEMTQGLRDYQHHQHIYRPIQVGKSAI